METTGTSSGEMGEETLLERQETRFSTLNREKKRSMDLREESVNKWTRRGTKTWMMKGGRKANDKTESENEAVYDFSKIQRQPKERWLSQQGCPPNTMSNKKMQGGMGVSPLEKGGGDRYQRNDWKFYHWGGCSLRLSSARGKDQTKERNNDKKNRDKYRRRFASEWCVRLSTPSKHMRAACRGQGGVAESRHLLQDRPFSLSNERGQRDCKWWGQTQRVLEKGKEKNKQRRATRSEKEAEPKPNQRVDRRPHPQTYWITSQDNPPTSSNASPSLWFEGLREGHERGEGRWAKGFRASEKLMRLCHDERETEGWEWRREWWKRRKKKNAMTQRGEERNKRRTMKTRTAFTVNVLSIGSRIILANKLTMVLTAHSDWDEGEGGGREGDWGKKGTEHR